MKKMTACSLMLMVLLFLFTGGCNRGKMTDERDGQTYKTVKLGDQTWLAQNLNYETDNSWCYDDDPANCETYGRLYDWEAALNACPDGWHLPSDIEWMQMEIQLGLTGTQASSTGFRGTSEGGAMKVTGTNYWNSPNTGATNSSGFSAVGSGNRTSAGNFQDAGNKAYFWTSTSAGSGSYYRTLETSRTDIYRYFAIESMGQSVRCVKN